MGIHADENLYPGINAHLNSFLQNEPGGWDSFHIEYVVALSRALDELLPLNYYSRTVPSLQFPEFREYDNDTLTGLMIYQFGKNNLPGTPVTRIELLSAVNKPGGEHHTQYMEKRLEAFQRGFPLVEIDLLHQTPPIIRMLPSYTADEAGAKPYMILVSNPRPTLEQGVVHMYGVGVDDTLQPVVIPLAGDETITVYLGDVYNRVFASSRFFRLVADYAQEPVHFDRYHETDRVLIQQRLEQIRSDAGKGKS